MPRRVEDRIRELCTKVLAARDAEEFQVATSELKSELHTWELEDESWIASISKRHEKVFYSPRNLTVSAKVSSAKGLITEWYPHADRVQPVGVMTIPA